VVDGTTPGNERRIGARVDVEPVEVRWILPEERSRRSRKPTDVVGWLVNLSITGAAINASSDLPVRPGMLAVLQIGRGRTAVRVKTSMPTDRANVRRFGVEFVDLQSPLKEEIYAVLGHGRPEESAWFRAT
jgi:hypothetical protein